MDGYVRAHRVINGVWYDLKGGYFGRFEVPKDSAEIMLVVYDESIAFFVNGKKIIHYDEPYLSEGDLALTLFSETNKDFGTKCEMTEIELWDLD